MSDEERNDGPSVVQVEYMKECHESALQVDYIPYVGTNKNLSDIPDLEVQAMKLEEIYSSPHKKDRKAIKFCGLDDTKLCCGTTVRCKQILLSAFCFVFAILLVFFSFAIIPIKVSNRLIRPLSSAEATTPGQIKVLLLGTKLLQLAHIEEGYLFMRILR